MRARASALLAGLVFAGLVGCRQPWPDDTLVIAVASPAKTLDPRMAVDAASTRIWRLVFAGLTRPLPDGAIELDLAAAIEPVELAVASTAAASAVLKADARGTLAYDVELRRDRRFHDGSPVGADDVVCTYRSLMDPRLRSPVGGEFARRFAAVRALGPHRVRFELRAPLATFASDLIMGVVPASTCAGADLRLGRPVGAGLFAVVPGEDGQVALDSIVLERVSAPPPGAPRRLVVRAIADEGGRALSVLGGGADIATGLSPPALRAAGSHRRGEVRSAPGVAWSYLAFNLRDAKLADRRVRLAFDLALDRDVLIQTVLGGRGRQAATMQPPGHWAVDPALAPRRQDRARAAALLDAALPVAPAQGAASAAAGAGAAAVVSAAPRLRLRLLTTASAQRRAEAEAIARQLAAVGVAVEVRSLEVGSLLAAVRAGQFDLYLLGLPEPLEPDYLAWMFHSGNASRRDAVPTSPSPYARLDRDLPRPAPPPEDLVRFPQCRSQHARAAARALIALGRAGVGLPVDHGAGNRTGYADPLVDCLVELGQAAATSAERAALYRAVGQRLHRDLPVLSLWHEDVAVLVGDRFDLPPPAADGSLAPWASARSRGAVP